MQLMLIDGVAVVWYNPPVLLSVVDDSLAYSEWLTCTSNSALCLRISIGGYKKKDVSHPLTSAREWWCESLCKHAEVEAYGWNGCLVEVMRAAC